MKPPTVERYRQWLAAVEKDIELLAEVRDSMRRLVVTYEVHEHDQRRRQDQDTATGRDVWGCSDCGLTYASESALTEHRCSEAAKRPTFPCPDCGQSFLSERGLSGHKGQAHRAPTTPVASKDSAYRGPGTTGGRLPQYDWVRGRQLWDEGASVEAIATALHCSAFTVKSAKQRYRWPARSCGGSTPTWDIVKGHALWDADTPTQEIARQCQVDRKTVQAMAVRQGWAPRGKGWRPPNHRPKPLDVRTEARTAPKRAQGYNGRERIPLTKHSLCGAFTTSTPCERCHLTVAPGERGVA